MNKLNIEQVRREFCAAKRAEAIVNGTSDAEICAAFVWELKGWLDATRAAIGSMKREPLSKPMIEKLIAQATKKRANLLPHEVAEAYELVELVEQAHGIVGSNHQHKHDGQNSHANTGNGVIAEPQWLPIKSAPKKENETFLVLLPGSAITEGVVFQVTVSQGHMYPDRMDDITNYGNRITTATHWMPRIPIPKQQGLREVRNERA